MPVQEIDEVELLRLRKLETQVGALLKNPGARKKLASAVKDVSPKDPLAAEADAVDPVEQRFTDLQAKLDAETKARVEAETKRDQEAKLSGLRTLRETGLRQLRSGEHDGSKWTDDGIRAVEALMEQKGILDPLDAAAIYEKAHPPQMPINPSSGTGGWNFMAPPAETETDLKALIESKGENIPLVDKIAWGAIQEVRGAQPSRR